MPQLLTTNATVTCPHMFPGTTTPATPIWAINGGPVCAEGDVGTLACTFPYPCVGYTLQSMGLTLSTVSNRKVILVTDVNKTLTGLPLRMIETHQVVDDSTTTPIPPGGSAPTLPPALQDLSQPVVVAAPAALAFNSVQMQPATLAAAFTLTHPFPANWSLTLISEPQARDQDVTAGVPPGLVISPADGAWDAPSLSVQLTMTAAYMASLLPGKTHFYMTGVSERGVTGFGELVLTVT